MASHLLPTVRYMLAHRLKGEGLREARIAKLMGLSQAAVSKYLRDRVKVEPTFLHHPAVEASVAAIARGLKSGSMSSFLVLAEMEALIRRLENRGALCTLHEALMPELTGLGCNLCIAVASPIVEEQRVLEELRAALFSLETLHGFAVLIPNVGTNLALAREGAREPSDVAAVPGRIYEMKGGIRIPAPPEFGASRHVAEVLVALQSLDPRIRAAINLRFSDAILAACHSRGLGALEIEASYEGRGEKIRGRAKERRRVPRVVFHRGGFGVEPILYLAGTSAKGVVEEVEGILRELGDGRGYDAFI